MIEFNGNILFCGHLSRKKMMLETVGMDE